MNEVKKKLNMKKIIIITLCSLFGIIVMAVGIGYLKVHSFINKLNIVDLDDEKVISEEAFHDEYEGMIGEGASDSLNQTFADGSNGIAQSGSTGQGIEELEEMILKNMMDNSIPLMEDKDVLNVLLIGSDTRIRDRRGLSDAMIVISINKKSKTITATSLLRDIYLKIPGREKNNRLNTAYAIGGAKLLIETIESNFKIKIDKYASVDFIAFIDIVDAVGGVTLEVTDKELPIVNDYIDNINGILGLSRDKDLLKNSGVQALSGKQTLAYSRVRYVGTDFGRTARQRKVLELIFEKVKKLSITEMNDLLNKILPKVTTNFKEGEIFSQILALPDYLKYDLEQWSIPLSNTYKNLRIRGMAVLGIDFKKNIDEMQSRIYSEY